MILTVKNVTHLQNPNSLVNTIYNNFIYLANTPQLQHNKQEILRLLTDENLFGLLVFNKDKLVGYLIGETKTLADGRYVYYISYVYVAKEYRKHKIGTQLLQILIKKCHELGVQFILLTCDIKDEMAYKFYLKNKFVDDPILKSNNQHKILIKYLQ